MATNRDHAWWLNQLEKRLIERRNGETRALTGDAVPGLDKLWRYYTGNPDLPQGAEGARQAWKAFQRMCRNNYAEPVVEAVVARLQVTAFRTAAADDDNGDDAAWRVWVANDMPAREAITYRLGCAMRDAYVMVNDPRSGAHGQAVWTIEDPRQTITSDDPLTRDPRAALKVYSDADTGEDVAHVMIRGEDGGGCTVRRFTRPSGSRLAQGGGWTPDEGYGAEGVTVLPFPDVPVVRYTSTPDAYGHGRAEHEVALDVIDRINSMLLLRVVIAVSQAFRQRAFVKAEGADELPPTVTVDEDGADLTIDEVFEATPAGAWDLPPGWSLWESAVTDLGPMLNADKADVQHLAALTRTPLDYLVPEGANQSAEGASLKREALLSKVHGHLREWGRCHARAMRLSFLWQGDQERADLLAIETDWLPPEHYSLAERYDAAVKAKAADVPWATRMRAVLQFTPPEIERMVAERDEDLLYSEEVAAVTAPTPVPAAAAAQAAPAAAPPTGAQSAAA